MYKPLKSEQETIITYDESTKTAEVYTHNKPLIRKLDALCLELPDQYQIYHVDEYSKTYRVPKKYIRVGRPVKMSKDRTEKATSNLELARISKKSRS